MGSKLYVHASIVSFGRILEAVDQDGETSSLPDDPRVLNDEMKLVLGRGGFGEGTCRKPKRKSALMKASSTEGARADLEGCR